MIKPTCRKCKQELTVFGAILLSPPFSADFTSDVSSITKSHICSNCYYEIISFIDRSNK